MVLGVLLLTPLTAHAGRVTLAWDPSLSGNVTGYTVHYGTASGVYTGSVDAGNQTTYTVTGLTRGVTYFFVVRAYSPSGSSAPSNEVSGVSVNSPPTITNPGNLTVAPGAFTLAISAADPDLDPLTYSATGLPSGVSINPATGVISGTVVSGTHTITASVTDGLVQVSTTFTLRVNRAPTLTAPGNQTNGIGDVVSLQLTASDPDGDPLTFQATGLPAALTLNTSTGRITGTLTANRGTYSVTVSVTDGVVVASRTFTWTVTAARFTDDPLIPGVHSMRVVHITELRTRIAALRTSRGLTPMSWTDPTLVAGSTPVKAVHLTQMRSALDQVYVSLNRVRPVYTDASITGMTIKAVHIAELRAAVAAVE